MLGTSTKSSLDEYLQPLGNDFGRKDRFFWAKVYLEGLLFGSERKSVKGIARSVTLPNEVHVEDACQALQNFIQESPWDEQRVLRQYRQHLVHTLGPEGVLVVEDVVLLKQGQHSVGVHRQFSTEQKKKVNCQILTTVFLVVNEHAAPLAFRLYLPRAWQEDSSRLAKGKVPQRESGVVSKAHVALELLKELRLEELPYRQLVAGESYARSEAFVAGISALDFHLMPPEQTTHLRSVSQKQREEDGSSDSCLWRVRALSTHLKDHLGLDHFEGRTWRGLHHHLCLVTLAHGYELHRRPLSNTS
jgi:SRSO17 transposase